MCKMNFIVEPQGDFLGAAVDGDIENGIFKGMAIVNSAGPWGMSGIVCDGECAVMDLSKIFRSIVSHLNIKNDGIDRLVNISVA